MKKLAALALVLALALGMGPSAFAETALAPESPSAGVTVTFDATVSYVVRIPATLAYDRTSGNTFTFSAEVDYVPPGQRVLVRIGGLADGGLVLTSGANAFSIPVTLGGAPCADGAVVAAFDAGGTADASLGALRLEPGASAPAQGKYSGTPTFTVSVE